MNRKAFLEKLLGFMLIAIPTYSLVSCSSSDDGNDTPNDEPDNQAEANCLDNGTQSSISANHGHSLTVSVADVQAGAARTYSIQGTSSHDHMVTLTAADFTSLQGNNSITVSSTADDGHTHSVTVRCA